MAIKLIRIDDRLIHGQVASSWLRHVDAEQILCVDDKAASNPVQQQVLKMAAPDLKVHVFSVDRFIEIYNNQPIKRSTFILITSTSDALRLKEGGVDISYINFGGMRSKEGRTSYDHDLSFSDKEMEDLHTLIKDGVKIDYQIAAYNEPVPILDQLKEVGYVNE